MAYTAEELAEAKRQIDSTLRKLREVVKTLEAVFTSVSVKYEHGRFLQRLPLKR